MYEYFTVCIAFHKRLGYVGADWSAVRGLDVKIGPFLNRQYLGSHISCSSKTLEEARKVNDTELFYFGICYGRFKMRIFVFNILTVFTKCLTE